jgi:hypothetical protein
MIDWMPDQLRHGRTGWVLLVIPAKAGIQSTRLSESSESLNLRNTQVSIGFNILYQALDLSILLASICIHFESVAASIN